MKLIPFFIQHFLPIGLIAVMGTVLVSAASPATSTRVDGFGINMSALPALTVENIEPLASLIESTGASYITQEINWSQVETSPDVYDWSAALPLDLFITTVASRDIQVVVILTGGPVYLYGSGPSMDRKAFGERWEKFVQAAVDHFGESVNIWQIGSEINGYYGMSPFLSPLSPGEPLTPDTSFYADVLRSASKIIKNSDPNDKVWMGNLTGVADRTCAINPLTFMLEMNATRAWKFTDAILYQPYQGAAAPEVQSAGISSSICGSNLMTTPSSLSDEVLSVQELARQLGGKTVIIDGLGWNSSDLDALIGGRAISTGQLEADLLVRASTALMAKNSIATIFWHADISDNASARNALANMQKALVHTKPLGQLQGMAGVVQEYRFHQGGEITSIAWRIEEGDTAYPVILDASDVTSFNAFASDAITLTKADGVEIPANVASEVVVMLNERPVIFIGKSSDFAGNIKQSITDQVELWQMEIKNAIGHVLNDQKAAISDLLNQWFEQAKDSAVQWGEEQLDELLP